MKEERRFDRLLSQYVNAFETLGPLVADETLDPITWQLRTREVDEFGERKWLPIAATTRPSALEAIRHELPGRLPRLYEQLVLGYRWAEVDLQNYRLLANPPGEDLSGLLREMSRDSGLWSALIPAGYIQFGRGPDLDYDPVCFHVRSHNHGDCRILKIDHEEILCNNRVKVVAELASSFEALVLQTIEAAQRKIPAHP